MKRTNEMIFADIRANGFITEREMLTLKAMSNKAKKDLLDYDTINHDGAGTPIAPEWAEKGLNWLKGLLTSKGEPRKGQNLGYREIDIIKTARPEDFAFTGFINYCGSYYPVYKCGGMRYFVDCGYIQVIG